MRHSGAESADTDSAIITPASAVPARGGRRFFRRIWLKFWRAFSATIFSSLTRRIVYLNIAALAALLAGMLYLNSFREGLIDARVQSLLVQGEIIAGAIASSASVEDRGIIIDPDRLIELQNGDTFVPFGTPSALQFPINPERVAPLLRSLVTPTGTRARIYDDTGTLILDSRNIYARGEVLLRTLPTLEPNQKNFLFRIWDKILQRINANNFPLYKELSDEDGILYPEVKTALAGSPASFVRVTEQNELVVSVAVPIQRFRAVLGVLFLSTKGGDINDIIATERFGMVRVFLIASTVTFILSLLLARTISHPMRRLSDAADRVRRSITARQEIPDFTHRTDEIGHLSGSLRDMTDALYDRIEGIEKFAADVAHELKNPLTSLRSAVETLPLIKRKVDRDRLLDVIAHDVRRLDRLISDISDASRLDAELVRDDTKNVDIVALISVIIEISQDVASKKQVKIVANIGKDLAVIGHESRLGQVVHNIVDNALSFAPKDSVVTVIARATKKDIIITIEDEGRGIRSENLETIFARFYTDRPDGEAFGQNSGLGLSISRQIIEAHGGTIIARNRVDKSGAQFIITLPKA